MDDQEFDNLLLAAKAAMEEAARMARVARESGSREAAEGALRAVEALRAALPGVELALSLTPTGERELFWE